MRLLSGDSTVKKDYFKSEGALPEKVTGTTDGCVTASERIM